MPSAAPRSLLASLCVLLLLGCHSATTSGARMWVELGDRALEADPGRALADYLKARESPDARVVRLDTVARVREAAARWLRQELAAQQRGPAKTPQQTLGLLRAFRATASSYGAAELDGELAALEREAVRAAWQRHTAALARDPGTPFQQVARWARTLELLPASEPQIREEATRELALRREALLARYPDPGPARGSLIARRLAAAARAAPGRAPGVPLPAGLALALGIDWRAEITGCEGLASALEGVARLEGAGHRGSLTLQLTCEGAPTVRIITRDVTVYDERQEERTHFVKECGDTEKVCHRYGVSGNCLEWTGGERRCGHVAVKRMHTVSTPRTVKQRALEESVVVRAAGTMVVELDGVSRSIPVDERARVLKTLSVPHAISELSRSELGARVRTVVREAVEGLRSRQLELAAQHLAAGEDRAAEDALLVAVAAGAGGSEVPAAFSKLAERDGLAFADWREVVISDGLPFAPSTFGSFVDAPPVASPELPPPDVAGVKVDAEVKQATFVELTADRFAWRMAAALTHWQAWGGQGGPGLTARLGLGGGGRFGLLPLSYFYEVGLGAEGALVDDVTFGAEGLARVGAGLRTRWLWLTPYLLGGASGNGGTGAGTWVPWAVEGGVGLLLAVPVSASSIFELRAERVSRLPGEVPSDGIGGAGAVSQRLRYELRYVLRTHETEMGLGVGCAFHQSGTADVVLPLSGARSQRCEASGFVSF